MKKENIYKFLYFISIILILFFIIILGYDYFNYDTSGTSAPFYVFIFARVLEFIIPSILLAVIGKILKKKYNKKS